MRNCVAMGGGPKCRSLIIARLTLVRIQGSIIMSRWLFVVLHLLFEGMRARRDSRIRFLRAQVDMLRSKLDRNRVILSPKDRAHLLRVGSELGHDVNDVLGIVTCQTYRRWVREQHAGREPRRVGRPRIGRFRRQLVIRFAKENLGWGYRRIVGELAKLHLPVGRSSIRRILRAEGLFPPPNNQRELAADTPWRKFIRLHMNTLVACDFFTKAVITPFGVRTAYCLFFIHLSSRRVFLSPATYHPHERWMSQQARNVQMWLGDHGVTPRFLLHDRDTKFTPAFNQVFRDVGTRIVKTPVQAPNANAFAEAWVGSLKRECLNHFLCFGLRHLDHIAQQYIFFYNRYRPHQGVSNRTLILTPDHRQLPADEAEHRRIRCQRFLGGLLRHYYHAAA